MRPSIITVMLALAALLSALRAAWLWWKASKGTSRSVSHTPGSEGHALQMEVEASDASALNAKAALWSGGTALFSAMTSIWSALGPLL